MGWCHCCLLILQRSLSQRQAFFVALPQYTSYVADLLLVKIGMEAGDCTAL